MPAKKGSKYLNAKTSSILSQYNPEDIQELLNSGEFKSIIARRLGIHIKAFNAYISEHNLTYKTPKHKGGIQPNAKDKTKKKNSEPLEEPLDRFKRLFQENKQKRTLQELKDGYY